MFDASSSSATAPATTLVLAAIADVRLTSDRPIHATATLTSGGKPVAGKTVTFSVGNDQDVGVTNASGVATGDVLLTSVPGDGYLLSASFIGDSTPARRAATSHPFTIGKVDTTITLTGPASPVVIGTNSTITATLKAGTTPIPFKTVWFVVTGTSPVDAPLS